MSADPILKASDLTYISIFLGVGVIITGADFVDNYIHGESMNWRSMEGTVLFGVGTAAVYIAVMLLRIRNRWRIASISDSTSSQTTRSGTSSNEDDQSSPKPVWKKGQDES